MTQSGDSLGCDPAAQDAHADPSTVEVTDAKKTCIKCKVAKASTADYFGVDASTKDKKSSYCKACLTLKRREQEVRRRNGEVESRVSPQKRCPTCGVEKPRTMEFFGRSSGGVLGLQNFCRECSPKSAKQAAYYARNKDHFRALRRKNVYGLDASEYARMLCTQNGVCAICKQLPSGGRGLVIDHDHVTSAVRGLLCNRCNSGIGHLGDDVCRLEAAIAYLTKAMDRAKSGRIGD